MRYFRRLLPLTRSKLRDIPDRLVDEEDALVSVFDRFFRAAQEGRFPQLADRDDLWQILLMLTDRKVTDLYRHATAQKRAEGKPATDDRRFKSTNDPLDGILDHQPTPEFAAILVETTNRALRRLPDSKTREVAVLRMEGYLNREIAQRLGVSVATIERKLRVIREVWQ